jgi:hypothetical protein
MVPHEKHRNAGRLNPTKRKDITMKGSTTQKPAPQQVQQGTDVKAPRGRRITGNLGAASCYPGAGKLVQRTGERVYCGEIAGVVFGYIEHPNSKNPARTSTRFNGKFKLLTHLGNELNGAELYLPGAMERPLKGALQMRGSQGGNPIPFAVQVWCEPDAEGRPSPLGYSYACYDRQPERADDPVLTLMYDAGMLARPERKQDAIAGPTEAPAEGTYDPETGEVLTNEPAA